MPRSAPCVNAATAVGATQVPTGSRRLRQLVPEPPVRAQGVLPERLVELLAEVSDVHLDQVGAAVLHVPPDMLQDLVLRPDLTAGPHQVLQQRGLPPTEMDLDV